MDTCTFAGHREVYSSKAKTELENTLRSMVCKTDEIVFYVGLRGEFDSMAVSGVNALKRSYPEKKILLYLVEPYFTQRLNTNKDYYQNRFDGIIVPEELSGIYPKAAIKKRNRLLIDWSDTLIAYVTRDYGGAYDALKYAQKQRKRIIQIAQP